MENPWTIARGGYGEVDHEARDQQLRDGGLERLVEHWHALDGDVQALEAAGHEPSDPLWHAHERAWKAIMALLWKVCNDMWDVEQELEYQKIRTSIYGKNNK